MIKGKNIICISFTTWEGEFTKSTVQILSLLAKNNNVMFIEYPRTLKDLVKLFLADKKALALRIVGLKDRLVTIESNRGTSLKHLVMPPTLPINFIKNKMVYRFLSRMNTLMYSKKLQQICKRNQIEAPIVIGAYNPTYGLETIGKLEESLNVYYCYDGMDINRNHWNTIEAEKEYCKNVDGIIASSDFLKDEKAQMNEQCYSVKNGVDFQLFAPFCKTTPAPKKSKKKIGYVGCLDYRFDIDLVEHAVKSLPEMKFEFTGYLSNQLIKDCLSKYSNVTFKKSVTPKEVPALLASYDLGIIPYNNLEINKGIYPLKANEYLAVGLPVVMTNFAPLSDFNTVVSISNNKAEFLQHLQSEIANDSSIKIRKRIAFAKNNSWEKRAESFGDALEVMWNQKNKQHSKLNSVIN